MNANGTWVALIHSQMGRNFVLTFQQYWLLFTLKSAVSLLHLLVFGTTAIPQTQSILHHWHFRFTYGRTGGSYVLHAHISTIHSTHIDTRTPNVASHPTTQFPKSLTSISPSYSARHLPGYEIRQMNTKISYIQQFTA
jgi:hypothetical protein